MLNEVKIELSPSVWKEVVLLTQIESQFGAAQIKLVEDDY
jgi:hypothetical protein